MPCPVDPQERPPEGTPLLPHPPLLAPKHRRAESMNDARAHGAGKTEAKSQDLTRYQGSEERGHCISWNGTHEKWALRTGRL